MRSRAFRATVLARERSDVVTGMVESPGNGPSSFYTGSVQS